MNTTLRWYWFSSPQTFFGLAGKMIPVFAALALGLAAIGLYIAFLVVPTTYDYPELTAAALFEAAKSYGELKQVDQASKLLERLQREFTGTPWADAAKELHAKLKGA